MPIWRTDGVIITSLLHSGPVEFLYYWLHRALHHHFLYSRYHSHHHSSIITEPITCQQNTSTTYLPLFILNTNFISFFVFNVGCSCHSSICWTHSVFHTICNTFVDNNMDKNSLHSFLFWLHLLHWFHEQHGSLQFWANSQMALYCFSSFKVHHVHSLVSYCFSYFLLGYNEHAIPWDMFLNHGRIFFFIFVKKINLIYLLKTCF